MSRKLLIATLSVFAASFLFLMVPAGVVISQEIQDVYVTNFPDPQRIEGTVSVEGTIRSASLVSTEEIIVSPVNPSDTTRLITGGTLVTDRYPYAVLSLTGHVKGEVTRPGTVGVILIPDEEPVLRPFNEEGQMQFSLEVDAPAVTSHSPYFASASQRFTLAFPRYRMYLYNTSDKTVSVKLYAYLTSD
jgi:hypothetical protein